MKFFLSALLALFPGVLLFGETDSTPSKFSLGLGGFLGASYRVELLPEESAIMYLYNPHTFTNSPGTKKTKIKIPAERWDEFRKALDIAKVWEWKKEYVKRGIADGTVWDIQIVWGKNSIKSHGDNAFPPDEQWNSFRQAVVKLLDGKKFE